MLKVTDDGVHITLQPTATAPTKLTSIVLSAVIIATVAGLMAAAILPIWLGGLALLVTLVSTLVWQQRHTATKAAQLSGGALTLGAYRLSHQQFGQSTHYALAKTDTVTPDSNSITICDSAGHTIYHIQGFSDPKHCQVAAAVLQGKAIQTQVKAIRLSS